jgi:hypothetical protein
VSWPPGVPFRYWPELFAVALPAPLRYGKVALPGTVEQPLNVKRHSKLPFRGVSAPANPGQGLSSFLWTLSRPLWGIAGERTAWAIGLDIRAIQAGRIANHDGRAGKRIAILPVTYGVVATDGSRSIS